MGDVTFAQKRRDCSIRRDSCWNNGIDPYTVDVGGTWKF